MDVVGCCGFFDDLIVVVFDFILFLILSYLIEKYFPLNLHLL